MAKKKDEVVSVDKQTLDKRISKYLTERKSWRDDLKQYWLEMDKCQEMYEFYKSESSNSDSNVSLNTPFAIIESMVSRANDVSMEITVKAEGENGLDKFENWISSVIKDAINDPDIAQYYGTFRKIKEKYTRSFLVVGNAAAEIGYCYKTQILDGEKRVIADNPFVRTRSYKDIVFNPTKQFDNSDIYYVDDFVTYNDLKNKEYKEEKDDKGNVKKSGLYMNLETLKKSLKDNDKFVEDSEESFVSGDKKISRKKSPIHIVTRWENAKMVVMAITSDDSGVIIREATDPFRIGTHNLLLSMDYVVEGRPYAYGEISAIYKPVRAQDTIVNQGIDIVNKYLQGSYVIDQSMDIDSFMLLLKYGGAMHGNPQNINVVPASTPPGQAFTTIDVLQQAIERTARFSPYSAGTPSSATDKTAGTKGGIQAIQAAAEPNFQVKLDAIEDSFMQPIARKYLMMIANLMGEDEIRKSLLKGENKEWIKATKGILMGKATIQDMVTAGLIDETEAQDFVTVTDPETGQKMPVEGADKAYVFDFDWIVKVSLDAQSSETKKQEADQLIQFIEWAKQMGVQFDPERTVTKVAYKKGFDEIDEIMLTEEEKQKKQQEMMAQQQAQQEQQMGQQQAQAQQAEAQSEQKNQIEQQKMAAQMQMKQMELHAKQPQMGGVL